MYSHKKNFPRAASSLSLAVPVLSLQQTTASSRGKEVSRRKEENA